MLTSMWMQWSYPRTANPLPKSTQLSTGIPRSSGVGRLPQTLAQPPKRGYCKTEPTQQWRHDTTHPDEKRLDDCKRWIISGPLIFRFCITFIVDSTPEPQESCKQGTYAFDSRRKYICGDQQKINQHKNLQARTESTNIHFLRLPRQNRHQLVERCFEVHLLQVKQPPDIVWKSAICGELSDSTCLQIANVRWQHEIEYEKVVRHACRIVTQVELHNTVDHNAETSRMENILQGQQQQLISEPKAESFPKVNSIRQR